MTTPSGQIALSDVNIEIGNSSSTQITMNDYYVRVLAGVPTGQIDMNSLRNQSLVYTITLPDSSTIMDLDVHPYAVSHGWDQVRPLKIIIPAYSIVRPSSTSNAAITIGGTFNLGVTIVNYGYIIGRGGDGEILGYNPPGNGGTGLAAYVMCTVYNYNIIAGGGGGGGASGDFGSPYGWIGGGGGSGYGVSGWGTYWKPPGYGAYWVYSGIYPNGGLILSPSDDYCTWTASFPGVINGTTTQVKTGIGGGPGQAGKSSEYAYLFDSKFNSWSAWGGSRPGGAAGNAVAGNMHIIWGNTGTLYGPIIA